VEGYICELNAFLFYLFDELVVEVEAGCGGGDCAGLAGVYCLIACEVGLGGLFVGGPLYVWGEWGEAYLFEDLFWGIV